MARISFTVGIEFERNGDQMSPDTVAIRSQKTIDYLLNYFDGVTIFKHSGGWRDSTGKTICEPGQTYVVYFDSNKNDIDPKHLALYIRDLWHQDCVLCVLEPEVT